MADVIDIFDKSKGDLFQVTCLKCGYEVWAVCIDDPADPCEVKLFCGNEKCDGEHVIFYNEDAITFDPE